MNTECNEYAQVPSTNRHPQYRSAALTLIERATKRVIEKS